MTIITLVAALASPPQDASTTKSTKGKKSSQDKGKRSHQPSKQDKDKDKDKANGKRTHDPLEKTY
jgi:hypothetical protein